MSFLAAGWKDALAEGSALDFGQADSDLFKSLFIVFHSAPIHDAYLLTLGNPV
jgi:hypothetical protein